MIKQFKFFIIDDDIFCANLYEQYLKNLNYDFINYFSNGEDCLDNLHLNPDIILLDQNLIDKNCLEVLDKIKRRNPNIYVVMLSNPEDLKIALEAVNNGAFDYIIKDDTVYNKLTSIISNIIKVKEQLRRSNPRLLDKILSLF